MTNFKSVVVETDEADQRLDRWLRRKYGKLPQSLIEKMCRKGSVKVDRKKVKPSFRLVPEQVISLPTTLGSSNFEIDKPGVLSNYDRTVISQLNSRIIYEDDYLVAVNKPPGIATQGGTKQRGHIDKYLNHLALTKKVDQLRLIHRLDKDTSGVLISGKSLIATREMMKLFQTKNVIKSYWAVALGVPNPRNSEIKSSLVKDSSQSNRRMTNVSTRDLQAENTAKTALTKYSVQLTFGKLLSFVLLSPQTGRTHQLRVHLSSINHPILGDKKYSTVPSHSYLPFEIQAQKLDSLMFLHARSLRFHHPFLKKEITIKAEVPSHFHELATYLEWDLKSLPDTSN